MEFGRPEWLNALYLVPVLAALFVFGSNRRRHELERFTGSGLRDTLSPGRSWRKLLLKASLRTAGLALVVLALALPRFGSQLVKVQREGIDLVIALDTSLSMLAEDMKPNRLERAKQEIIDLIKGLQGDRVGIVAFAGDAFVLCPLTVDYGAALMFTQSADIDLVSNPGSSVDQAIRTSVGLFRDASKGDRVVVLVSDGEGHDDDLVSAARLAAENDVRVYTIGIGSPAGELIPLRGTDGSVEGYKEDESGEPVLTRLDERALRQVAEATGGKYLPATREGLELKVLYREIAGLERKTVEGDFTERKTDRFPGFLLAAFALLALDMFVTRKGSLRDVDRGRLLHTGAAALALILLLLPLPATAKRIDAGKVKSGNQYFESDEYEKALTLYREAYRDTTAFPKHYEGVLYNQANALHMLGRYPEALGKYHESLSDDSLLSGKMLYNRGNTLVNLGKPDAAIESYLQALARMPDDPEAMHNLELALRMLQQQQQQRQQDQQGEEDDQEQSDEQQQEQQGDEQDQQRGEQDGQQQPDSSQAPEQQPDSLQSAPAQPDTTQVIQLTREDALRLLKLLEEQEEELQKEKRKAAFRRVSRGGKDW